MPINTVCTGCGKSLSVMDEHAGKRARCPACGQIYTVPLASTTNGGGQSIAPTPSSSSDVSSAIEWGATTAASPSTASSLQNAPNQFWMRATDGSVYGPVDREGLDRWFKEGRVGMGYQIRQGELGSWQEAAAFRPQVLANPYTAPASALQPSGLHRYPRPDRGVLVLVMGVLSFVVCGVFGLIAVIIGRGALRDIDAGLANPNDKTLVQIGFWLGVANLILHLVTIGGLLLALAIGIISEAG